MDFVNLEIVGTSHIAPESKRRILRAFNSLNPDIVCVELDSARLTGLKDKNRKGPGLSAIRQIGVTGFLFASIGGFIQKKLGKITGMMPGEEMLLAVSLAEDSESRLELIDQDVKVTLKKINRIPFREKARIVWDVVRAPFQRKSRVKIDLSRVPEEGFVRDLTEQLKKRYPYIYGVIIDERNRFMAKRLFVLRRDNPSSRILVVVGEGHVLGLKEHLKKLEDANLSFVPYKS